MNSVASALLNCAGTWLLLALVGAGFLCRGFWGRCAASWRHASQVIVQTEADIAEVVARGKPPAQPHHPQTAPGLLPCGHATETAFSIRTYRCGSTTTHGPDGRVTAAAPCGQSLNIEQELRDLLS